MKAFCLLMSFILLPCFVLAKEEQKKQPKTALEKMVSQLDGNPDLSGAENDISDLLLKLLKTKHPKMSDVQLQRQALAYAEPLLDLEVFQDSPATLKYLLKASYSKRSFETKKEFFSEWKKQDLNSESQSFADFVKKSNEQKYTIVFFWATWCHPCLKEIPYVIDFVKQHPEFKVVAIAQDNLADVKAKFKELKLTPNYPMLLDEEREILTELGIDYVPLTIVLDQDLNWVKSLNFPDDTPKVKSHKQVKENPFEKQIKDL